MKKGFKRDLLKLCLFLFLVFFGEDYEVRGKCLKGKMYSIID